MDWNVSDYECNASSVWQRADGFLVGTVCGRSIALVFALVLLATSTAGGAEYGPLNGPKSDWSFTLGAFGIIKPEYEGSEDYEVTGFPIIYIKWRDSIFLDTLDGLGVYVWDDRTLSLSASVGYMFGRDHDKSNDLKGLGDIDGGAVGIVKADIRHRGFSFSTRFSHQFTGDDTGYFFDFGFEVFRHLRNGWFLIPGLSASYASGEYMDAYFGVTPGQARSSGLPAFSADAGFKTVGAGLLTAYSFNRNWSTTALFSYDRLIDDAANSPVTHDKDQFTFGLGLSRRF